jgi:replicative DNA helicase
MSIEVAVLGACLIEEPEAFRAVCRRVRPDHFSLDSHRRIYSALLKLESPNIVLLVAELGKGIAEVGGASYVASLTEGLPIRLGSTVHQYIDRLIEQWRLGEIQRISALMASAESNADEVIGRAMERLESLRQSDLEDTATSFLCDFATFASSTSKSMDWMVSQVIERGSNGFIAADPKTGKSFCAADLALSLATGGHWLDFGVPVPTRVAMVSREDNPALTAWRLRNLMAAKNLTPVQLNYLDQNLYVNTRQQTPSFMLDNEQEVRNLVAALRERKIEFVILDVLNVLHRSDENDNTQMAEVLRKAKRIQDETGAALGIIHHFNKSDSSTRITRRLRGASAIAGFAEWVIGISMADEENGIRKMEFELKAGAPPDPVYFVMDGQEGNVRVKRIAMQARSERSMRQ